MVEPIITLVTVTATDATNSIATYTFLINTISTEILQSNATSEITFYPNPVSDVLHIEGITYFDYEILDNVGSLVMKGTNALEVHVSVLARGMYVILL